MKEFIEVIRLYLNNLKKKMVENTGLKIHSNSNFKTLDADVNELHK